LSNSGDPDAAGIGMEICSFEVCSINFHCPALASKFEY